MGGKIFVQSKLEKGTTFEIEIPNLFNREEHNQNESDIRPVKRIVGKS